MKSFRLVPYWMRVRNFWPPPVKFGQFIKSKFPWVISMNPTRLSTVLKPAPKLSEPVRFSSTCIVRSLRAVTPVSSG